MKNKYLKLLFGILFSVGFIYTTSRIVVISDIVGALHSVNSSYLLVAIIFLLLGYACRIERWRQMLTIYQPSTSWRQCAVPFFASIAANNILPLRAGDAMRAVTYSRWLEVPTARILGTMLVERVLDVLTLILLLITAFVIFGSVYNMNFLLAWIPWLLIFCCLVFITLLWPSTLKKPLYLVSSLIRKILPAYTRNLNVHISNVLNTFQILISPFHLIKNLSWSILAWGFEACTFYAVALSFPDLTNKAAAYLSMLVGTLSTMLPSTPGHLGTFHFFVLSTMESVGNPTTISAAFAVLVHIILYFTITIVGGACFIIWLFLDRKYAAIKTTGQRNDT